MVHLLSSGFDMTLRADQMEKIVAQVARGAPAPDNEPKEAADFRAGVTAEVDQARQIAEDRGLPFVVEIPNETPEMW